MNFSGAINLYGVAGGKTAAIVEWKNESGKMEILAVGYAEDRHTMLLEGLTEALAVGAMALRAKGVTGKVAVHIGGMVAAADVSNPGWFGSLSFSKPLSEIYEDAMNH